MPAPVQEAATAATQVRPMPDPTMDLRMPAPRTQDLTVDLPMLALPMGGAPLKNVVFPSAANWDFYGPQKGEPQDVLDVAMDEGGNLWVAGGKEGLFLMRADSSGRLSETFEKFGIADGLHPYGWLNGETAQIMGVPDGTPSDPNPSLDATPVVPLSGG